MKIQNCWNRAHWGKKPHFSQKIHMFKITYFKKFTILKLHFSQKITSSKSYFSQKSRFKSPFFTKIAFSKYHFSQKSHFRNLTFHKNHIVEAIFRKINIIWNINSSEFMDKKCVTHLIFILRLFVRFSNKVCKCLRVALFA